MTTQQSYHGDGKKKLDYFRLLLLITNKIVTRLLKWRNANNTVSEHCRHLVVEMTTAVPPTGGK